MDKFAVVTGGISGLGLDISQRLIQMGYHVISIHYPDDPSLVQSAYDILPAGKKDQLDALCYDLSSFEPIQNAAASIIKLIDSSKITFVVHCAGTTYRSSFEEMEWDAHQKVMNVNLTGPLFLTQKLLPFMVNSEESCILYVGSIMSSFPHGTSLTYGLSKSGLEHLTRWLAVNLESKHIRCNCIQPGFIDTNWQKEKPKDQRQRICAKILSNRFAEVGEIGEMAIGILQNKYMNASVVDISCGYGLKPNNF